MSDRFDDDRRLRGLLVLVLLATIVGGGIDLLLDAPGTWRSAHAVFEATLILAAMATSIVLWRCVSTPSLCTRNQG